MNDKTEYVVQLPLAGHPDGWFDVARAVTPEGAGELVRVLLQHRDRTVSQIRIDVRVNHASERQG